MRLAISNIAWETDEDEEISRLLLHHAVDAIDIAPRKYFHDPMLARDNDVIKIKKWWSDRGIEITGMQALLFGIKELNLFSSADTQKAMLDYLSAICRIGACLGATRLVFGSPKNRDRSGLTDGQALDMATSFFHYLGDIAQTHGVIICLEPNPERYGANFMTSSMETANVVEHVAHPAIRMQLDTGAIAINGENIDDVLSRSRSLIGHLHASEPDLLPLGEGGTDHRKMYHALSKYFTDSDVICIEMAATGNESHVAAVGRALSCGIEHYQDNRESSK